MAEIPELTSCRERIERLRGIGNVGVDYYIQIVHLLLYYVKSNHLLKLVRNFTAKRNVRKLLGNFTRRRTRGVSFEMGILILVEVISSERQRPYGSL